MKNNIGPRKDLDIVDRLRGYNIERSGYAKHCHRAADEIERLRAEVEALRAALQKVLDDSETGVVPRSHLDLIERLLRSEGEK